MQHHASANTVALNAESTYLPAIDEVLSVLSSVTESNLASATQEIVQFCRVVLQSQCVPEDLWSTKPVAAMLDRNIGRARSFVGVCLLRLLDVNEAFFGQQAPFARAFALFDDVFDEPIRRAVGIQERESEYARRGKYKQLVPLAEDKLKAAMTGLDSLGSIATFRHGFFRALNDKLVKQLIWPFLPATLPDVRLKELFKIIEDYVSTGNARTLQAYQEAEAATDRLISEAEAFGTHYSRVYLAEPAKQLRTLLSEHMAQSTYSKPGLVEIGQLEKKYPLSVPGAEFNISVPIHNSGPGFARDVLLKVISAIDLCILKHEIFLGTLSIEHMQVEIPALANDDTPTQVDFGLIEVEVTWTNFDGSLGKAIADLDVFGQRADINWEALANADPYDLEPATTEQEFVGRAEIVNRLKSLAQGKTTGSAYIWGQKRVGKTSIAKVLANRLRSHAAEPFVVVYLESGDYILPDPEKTIDTLGRRICDQIQRADDRLSHIPIPQFSGGLAPLTEFIDRTNALAPELRIMVILDEFDELPFDLFRSGRMANALFLPLRTISGKALCGFLLVGGEKMDFIIEQQGERLHKFKRFQVDYFDRKKHWTDFQDLVRRPVADCLEISDEALSELHAETSGNPYFTKLVCSEMFNDAVARRDNHMTAKEIREAVSSTLLTTGSPSFQHFWADGILEEGERRQEILVDRRKVLLSFNEAHKQATGVEKSEILACAAKYGLHEEDTERTLQDFVRRGILVLEDTLYHCHVPLFAHWLSTGGARQLINSFGDEDITLARHKEEAEAYVRPDEITHLVNSWGPYKGRAITGENVRAWLAQFGDNRNQRLMFYILQSVKFYGDALVREKLHVASGILARHGVQRRIQGTQRKTRDVLVSYLEGNVGKSGSRYARLYAEENNIHADNVMERKRLLETLNSSPTCNALVFVDDFIGTGESVCKSFEQLNLEGGDVFRSLNFPIFFFALCGFAEASDKIQRKLERLDLPIEIHICDPLMETDKCFSEQSNTFPTEADRQRAREIAWREGKKLSYIHPLGFGDCQAIIVFEDSCPNDTLPILWANSKDETWIAIFPR